MICIDCRSGHHIGCRGGTWCDCQHRSTGHGYRAHYVVVDEVSWHEVRSAEELTALIEKAEAADILGEHGRSDL